jgi:hypothetical protein
VAPIFTGVLSPGDIKHAFGKLDQVEVFDPDGSVSERVMVIEEAS